MRMVVFVNSVHRRLDDFFGISTRASSVRTEVIAGVYTFLSLSYIFVIHPVILGSVGFEVHAVLRTMVVVSVLVTVMSGLWSRLPFVFAPGLEMSLYVAFVAIQVRHLSVPQSLAVVLVTGV